MEFRFNLHPLFRSRIVRINNSLLPTGFVAPSRRVALDATAQISEIINFIGTVSAAAQGLSVPVTTPQKLRNSDHLIYLMFEPNDKNGLVVGILKVGRKSLYVFDEHGETVNVTAPCVLDFYVHESRQRGGLGRELFDHMLREENIRPDELAIDRPSEKMLGFLQKHYGLHRKIPQMNNFVVYEGFFASKQANSDIDGRRMHITASPNTNLFGPTFTTTSSEEKRRSSSQTRPTAVSPPAISQPPVGRYAAKRPSCSMAQIIHNNPTAVSAEPNSTATNNHHHHHHQDERDQHEYGNGGGAGGDDGQSVADGDDTAVAAADLERLVLNADRPLLDALPPPDGTTATTGGGVVTFADDHDRDVYADMPEPGPDPDPYDYHHRHPHHLELSGDVLDDVDEADRRQREHSLSPQSISQQVTPEHPGGPRKLQPVRYSKQHTGMKNVSFGVGAAVTPTAKMEFDQEENEGFGSVKINRPIGKGGSGTGRHHHDDGESVYSRDSNGSHRTDQGHFDLKFYHNKLW